MNVETNRDPGTVARAWLGAFNAALAAADASGVAALFRPDADWRDIVALTWSIRTTSDRLPVAAGLIRAAAETGARDFAIDPDRTPPRLVERAGETCIEAILRFETRVGRGAGILRIRRSDAAVPGAAPPAWALVTVLESLNGFEEETIREATEEPAFEREFHGPNWLDRRRAAQTYADRDPAVLIVGGGHAGVTLAARLGALGIDTLVIDRMERVGDNWRKRYHGLKLHNTKHSNHFPYIPFPSTWPRYIPKDKIANWLEFYVEAMEINFWTRTTFLGATYDEAEGRWSARVADAATGERTLRPRHIVMATSVSGTPNLPEIPTLDRFRGKLVHSSGFTGGEDWRGRTAYVFGTGTSAHDIAQDLHGAGADVSIVQRSPTLIVNIEPGAQLYDGIYYGKGPSLEDRDLINVSVPLRVMRVAHKLLTDEARAHDAPLLQALEKVGFRLEFGENGTGWPLKYRQRGGGYYFNVGASDLVARGDIGLLQYADIAEFTPDGFRLKNGEARRADLIVLATGYKGQDHLVGRLFGPEVAARVGPVWGFDEADQELRNMWMPTGQPGLWFQGGSFAQCRMYSKYLALQIKAVEEGLV